MIAFFHAVLLKIIFFHTKYILEMLSPSSVTSSHPFLLLHLDPLPFFLSFIEKQAVFLEIIIKYIKTCENKIKHNIWVGQNKQERRA